MAFNATRSTLINWEARARHNGQAYLSSRIAHTRGKEELCSIRPLPWPNGEAYLYPYIRTGVRSDISGTIRVGNTLYNCRHH